MSKTFRKFLVVLLVLTVTLAFSGIAFAYEAQPDDGDRSKQNDTTMGTVYSSVGMFRTLNEFTSVNLNEDGETATVKVKISYMKSANYDRIALSDYPEGDAEQVKSALDPIAITADNLGTNGYITDTSEDTGETTYSPEFTFTVPLSDIGKRIPFVISASGTWKDKAYYMVVVKTPVTVTKEEGLKMSFTGGELAINGTKAEPFSTSYALTLFTTSTSYDKVRVVGTTDEIELVDGAFKDIPVVVDDFNDLEFHSEKSDSWFHRDVTVTLDKANVYVANHKDPADPIKVTLTVNDKGKLAKANDGSYMVNKEVAVEDLDRSGDFTYDEALVAAHKAYNEEDGYALAESSYGGMYATKFWGDMTGNYLFFVNGETGTTVDAQTVENGDDLYVSINKDAGGNDWYTTFAEKELTASYCDNVTFTLVGHLGMAWDAEQLENKPIANATIKTVDGTVLGTTNDKGELTIKAPAVGDYLITAEGTVPGGGTDWTTYEPIDAPIMAPAAVLTVEKADISKAKVASVKDQTYTGKDIKPTPKVTLNGKTLKKGTDYTLTYKNNKNVGKATITIKGKGNYKGTATKTFKIVKAKNTLKATAKKKTFTVKYAKLKKANQTLTRKTVLNVTKEKGTVTYKKTSGTKKITVNKKTGKITIKKGLKKSTYTIKIKVTAAGTKNYKSGSKTVTVKIKVK